MSQKTIIITATVVIVCFIITGLVFMIGTPAFLFGKESSEESTTPETLVTPTNTVTITQVPENTTLKDGTYTATGTYSSPEGIETISVTVTLKNNVISGTKVVGNAKHPKSKTYQSLFSQGIGSRVNGKMITEVTTLGNVNGSSLTGAGFIAALQKIMQNAQ
jgi:uncharacterized protein with FMN-binding domain